MDDLLQEFIAETRETLEALTGEIIAWESDPSDRNRLDAIFRFVHTVKGSCGFLELPRLSRLSHAAEDALAAVRSGTRTPSTMLVNAVLAIVDRIGEIIEAIDAGAALDDSGEDLLIAALGEGAEAAIPGVTTMTPRSPTRSVRLNVDLLDRMMSGMSDMVLARNELSRRLRDTGVDPAVEAALDRLSLTVSEMRDTVTRTRMQKIEALFSALPRMVRDTAAELGKSVTVIIDGADVELDREMIEMMRDPLVHIVRNAIDHGIELPSERRAAGKRENGRLLVSARQSGNQIIIEIADDGRGVDVSALVARMATNGTRSEAALNALPEKAKLNLIFEPGVTSRAEVTAISGRGVGMDVVRANIEQIGGRVELVNMPGRGLSISIYVPLTLSIISTIVVGAAGQRFAVSRPAIEEILTVRGESIRIDMLGDTPIATVRDRRLPLVALDRALGIKRVGNAMPTMLAIVSVAAGSFALAVDSIFDTEELVIKPAPPAIMETGLYAGQTLPDSGLPMLLLDCAGIAAAAGLHFTTSDENRFGIEDHTPHRVAGTQMLLFRDFDGVRRAAPLEVIDRVEITPTHMIRESAGLLRWANGTTIMPLATCRSPRAAEALAAKGEIDVLRLADGRSEIGYAIAEALDIVEVVEAMLPARISGPVAGVVQIDGEPVEILDIHWLFAANAEPVGRENSAPICLLAGGESAWMDMFLRPVLEGAGYRVATSLGAQERAAVTLVMAQDEVVAPVGQPVVRLRDTAIPASGDDGSIYRYDRNALLATVASCTAQRSA
ncbi:MAG: chemotaxis protein CheA [Sphingomonas sp.]